VSIVNISSSEAKLLEAACKDKLLSKWPESGFIEGKTGGNQDIDFVIELAEGGVGIIGRKSQPSTAKKSKLNMGWSLGRIEVDLFQAIARAVKLNHPVFHTTYSASRVFDKKDKKSMIGFKVTLARSTAKLGWEELFPDDPIPVELQWTVAKQSAKKQGKYLVVVHTLKDGRAKQVNEYKLEIEKISHAIYESTLKFKTFPFNIPHSHKITEKDGVQYDRSIDDWEQHVEQKGVLEDSRVQQKNCSACAASFFDTSSQDLCYSCFTAEQSRSRAKAIKLCKQAEKLSTSTDWQATAAAIKQLRADWQQLKAMSWADSEKLWGRFHTANQRFFDARGKLFDQQDEARLVNKKKAERLIAKAKKLAGSDSWKETGDAIKSLQQDWKAVNPLPREDADELWQEFRTATQSFFDRRSAYFDELDSARNDNRSKAEELIKQARRWAASADRRQAAEELKKLQQEWKTVNPLPRDSADELWRTFREVCQAFFDRRR
jgi:hypothetical protein